VWIRGRVEGEEEARILAQGAIDGDGRYVMVSRGVAGPFVADEFAVGAAVDGYDATWVRADPRSIGKDVVADLRASEGRDLTGTVVDDDGKPVAGLRLRFDGLEDGGSSARLENLAPLPDALARDGRFVRTQTDAQGRFTLHTDAMLVRAYVATASPQPMMRDYGRFVSESPSWFLREEGTHGLHTREIRLRATPSAILHAHVVDDRSGKPVAKFEGHLRRRGHESFVAFDGGAGRLELVWPRWWPADEEGVLDLAVEAEGYEPAQVPIRFDVGQRDATVEVRMRAIGKEELARVTFEVVGPTGAPLDAPWWLKLVDPRATDSTLRDLGVLERRDAGVYEAAVPPGTWTVLLQPNDDLGFLRWTGEIVVSTGQATRVRCPMAAHGTLVIRWPKLVGENELVLETPSLSVSPADGGMGSGLPMAWTGGEHRLTTVPEGDWIVRASGTNLRVERNVRVRAGEETVVDLGEGR
jgi:hypothetical protein